MAGQFVLGRNIDLAGHFVFGLNAESQMASSVNASLDEDTSAAPPIVPDEHAVPINMVETKGVISCHRDFLYSEGSGGIMVDSKTLTTEAGSQAECRICQEEEDVEKLETPCACSGSMKHAHRICIQRWCYEKGDTICEICHEPYSNDYRTIPGRSHAEVTPHPLDGEQGITVSDNEQDHPGLVTMGAAEGDFQHADSDKYKYMFVLGFFFFMMLVNLVFYMQGVNDSDLAIGIAFIGAGGLCCIRYIITTGVIVIHERQRHQIAVSTGIYRHPHRHRYRRRRQQDEVAMGADVAQWAPNLELATDLLEHRIMIPAEVERSTEQGT